MYVPNVKKTKPQKKHFYQKHPVIGRFFETFGCLGWAIVIIAVVSLVMFLVPAWRPTLYFVAHKIGYYWSYFWGDLLPNSLRWDWSEPTPRK